MNQKPLITASEILLLGQNPGKRQKTRPAKHPFGLDKKPIVAPWQFVGVYTMGSLWALYIAHEIYKHTREIPNVANLVSEITEDNKINEELVLAHSAHLVEILQHVPIKLVFCFGSQTFEYFDRHFAYGRCDGITTVKLAHPAYVSRWKQNDKEFLNNQIKSIYDAIVEEYDGETPAETFIRLGEYS